MDDSERMLVLEDLARQRVGYAEGLDLDKLDQRRSAHRRSPTCGDEFTVHLDIADDIIRAVTWRGHGCVISQAAASALASAAPGLSVPAFSALAEAYFATIPAGGSPLADRPDDGDLTAFAGIGRFPLRSGCATLAWRTALDALGDDH